MLESFLWSFICARPTNRHKWRCYGHAFESADRNRIIQGLRRDAPEWLVGYYQEEHPRILSPYLETDRPANHPMILVQEQAL